jgi:hypothetical protein
MHTIAEQNLLLRAQIKLPVGLNLATEEFREGWDFVGVRDARLLEKKILKRGWNFIRIVNVWLRSGVGESPQMAIAGALSLALRQASPHFNAAEVNRIEWTQYPGFFLARVTVNPYRIQQNALLPVPDSDSPPPVELRAKLLPSDAAALFPNFGSAMPMLREMLVLSSSAKAPASSQVTIQ